MKLGFVGLGKMGLPMSGRLADHGHTVYGYDAVPAVAEKAAERGVIFVKDFAAMAEALGENAVVWVQTPPGKITNDVIAALAEALPAGSLIVDGGNSDFRDSRKNGEMLAQKGIHFVDCGVSGGVNGAKNGAGLLVGATQEDYEKLLPAFEALAAPDGYRHVGGPGAGHFSKMVHNAVEYAIMEAYAEGYELMKKSDIEVDILSAMEAWQKCSIRSFLLDEMIEALRPDVDLDDVIGVVADSGMGRWAQEEAIRLRVPTPVLSMSLQARFRSQEEESPAMKSLAALRGVIGGHPVKRKS
ncbi:MAG: NADP-dependent phosphogluconate dehydrogenase [Lachnospiraceae bacterium]|nr:NADP-dependent phosphogluconate dehydrogenase [Lachnospiraceae bacterium]